MEAILPGFGAEREPRKGAGGEKRIMEQEEKDTSAWEAGVEGQAEP